MKKLILTLTIAAIASVASLQAGEGKECAKACDKATAKAAECAKTAKAAECAKTAAAKSCCNAKKVSATAKGASQLLAQR